jgi:iron complex outermembrane receptor protein
VINTLRGSVSTGFRAPTLHQIYTQRHNIQLVKTEVSGIINNVSPARLLGVDQLDAKIKLTLLLLVLEQTFKNFNFTVDTTILK